MGEADRYEGAHRDRLAGFSARLLIAKTKQTDSRDDT